MNLGGPRTIKTVSPPRPVAEIVWPCPEGGKKEFPVGNFFWTNHHAQRGHGNYFLRFFKQVEDARMRVWIIDKFFLGEEGCAQHHSAIMWLCNTLEHSSVDSIRILASSSQNKVLTDAREKIVAARNSEKHGRSDAAEIEIKGHLKSKVNEGIKLIHDRFAIVDDNLWHFGSTVGGVHPSLSAVSGPWCARDTRASDFFEHIWGQG